VGRIFHGVVHAIEAVPGALARAAVQGMETLFFDEGLYLVKGRAKGAFRKAMMIPVGALGPEDRGDQPTLLFIHGVLSSADGCFDQPGTVIWDFLASVPGNYRILAYNHFSASRSIREIAQNLHVALQGCLADGTSLRILAHSQGGIIARELASLRPVDHIITLGSPHRGTHLANSLEKWVTLFMALDAPVLDFLCRILKFVDDDGGVPGFTDLKVGGDYITALNSRESKGLRLDCGGSDFHPAPGASALQQLFDEVDSWGLFLGQPNDLVVDTCNAFPPAPFAVYRSLQLDPGSHVCHTQYFDYQLVAAFLKECLPL
jgi:pimeloyl-ACP methyl ester carboxylesterase